ncbi:MAG: D-amino acid dehydrogenase [Betaproteobacteria bacterium]|nr:D-amino acid dehydrogenase [Betaproteobacteria bacterium]
MKVIVLGAGVVGVTSAWYLAQAGHQVTVIDRQPGAGLETSFANGGQISASHGEPWANPGAPWRVLKWLGQEDAPLLFRLRADPAQWRWALSFLRECTAARTHFNTDKILKLAEYSRQCLGALRSSVAIDNHQMTQGILHFYTDEAEFAEAIHGAEAIREFGAERQVITADEAIAREPALAASRERLVGATYCSTDESGDAHEFTRQLAEHCVRAGVVFRYSTSIEALQVEAGKIASVRLSSGTESADAYIVSLGSYSPLLLKAAGISIPVYPVKGYSFTASTAGRQGAPQLSMLDEEFKIVYSRFGERLRVAGTAELNGYDTSINATRCQALVKRTRALFADAADFDHAEFWAGLRPATPSNRPLIGRMKYPNLYLNTGHGTLGWTQACGSAQALADLLSGKAPQVDFPFLS